VYCPDCGKENPSGQKFCRSCGLSLKPISQALAGEVVPADEPVSSKANSTVLVQGTQSFWQNPLVYALLLILLGIVIGIIGDKLVLTKMVTDMGTLIAVLGIGLLGFKGVMMVITPPRPSPGSHSAPQIEETSRLTPPLFSAEPPSVTENTTRQLDTRVARDKEKSRDTQPTT
jgi:zinc-ribbon domain